MSKRFVITLTAANRVGILAAVSNALAELGGDLWHISQTVVEKFFTMIIAADFPEARTADVVLDHIRAVCGPYNMEVTLKEPGQERLPDDPEAGVQQFVMTIQGENQPGIIRLVSGRLAQDQIDIVNLEAIRLNGGSQFLFSLEISTPPRANIEQLKTELAALGNPAFEVRVQSFSEIQQEFRPLRAFLR
jgi:glycine cleavage system transcriptional repressor